jgi:hypothetical protein
MRRRAGGGLVRVAAAWTRLKFGVSRAAVARSSGDTSAYRRFWGSTVRPAVGGNGRRGWLAEEEKRRITLEVEDGRPAHVLE